MISPLPPVPPAMLRLYRVARLTGTWPVVLGLRLRWLAWLKRQQHITDMRQPELLLEHYTLERLP